MSSRLNRTLLATTAILILASATPVLAQEKSTQGSQDNGDIIVTARRIEERLQDVPISITVFNQQQLTNSNVVNAQDLAKYTPSLSANSNYGADNSSFAIRGFVQENGTAPSVGTYFADVVAPRAASNGLPGGDGAGPGQFFDLQNVQVLKGPQGTLFGRNTTGGAVLLVPQKPTDKFEGYVEGSLGNYAMRRIQAVVNIPLADTLRIRLGVDRQTRDGYVHNVSGVGPSDFDNTDYTAVRASIVGDLTPNLENYTIFSYSNSHNHGPVDPMIAVTPGVGIGNIAITQFQDQRAKGATGFYDTEQLVPNAYAKTVQWQLINKTTWKASDGLTIKNIVSYAQFKQDLNIPLFGQAFYPSINGTTYPTYFATATVAPGDATANESTLTEELQVQGRTSDDRLTYQFGGYLESVRPLGTVGSLASVFDSCRNIATNNCTDSAGASLSQQFGLPIGAIPVGTNNLTIGQTSFHDIGLYAQGTYKLSDQFKFTGGIRYTWDHEANVSTQQVYSMAFPPTYGVTGVNCVLQVPNCTTSYYEHSQAPTWLADFDYTPNRDILLYAKYARGYRAGTIAPNIEAPLTNVRPEKVDSYEVGFKTSFHEGIKGTFNASAFYNKLSNQQVQVGFACKDSTPEITYHCQTLTAAPVNINKSEIYGVELEGSLTPFQGLTLNGGYTYLHSELKSVPSFDSFNNDPNYIYRITVAFAPGEPEVLTPKNKYTFNATYTLPLDQKIGKVWIGATFTHRGSMLSTYINPGTATAETVNGSTVSVASVETLRPLNLLDLSAGWDEVLGLPVDLSAFVTNLTQQKYYTYISGLYGSTPFESAAIGEPRMFGFRLKYRFGGMAR